MLCQNSLECLFFFLKWLFLFWSMWFCPLLIYPKVSRHPGLPVGRKHSVLKPWKQANELGQRSQNLPKMPRYPSNSSMTDKSTHQLTVWLVTFHRNWAFPKTRPPLSYCCYVRQAMLLLHHTSCSHVVKNTLQSKEETDNTPTDNTEQLTSGMKQSLRLQVLSFFSINSNNKFHFVVL